jgi:hypothetical protein
VRCVALAAACLVFVAPATAQVATPGCRIGSFHAASSTFTLDVDGDGSWSAGDRQMTIDVAGGPGTPLVGDWNGDGFDDVGKQVGTWYRLDLDGDGVWEGNAGGDRNTSFGGAFGPGLPLVGDWNGDGRDEIGTYVPDSRVFLLDANGNGVWDGAAGGDAVSWLAAFAAPIPSEGAGQPLVGDWNGDGVDDIGKRVATYVYLDADGDRLWNGPFGGDRVQRALTTEPDGVLVLDWDLDGADEIGTANRLDWGGLGFAIEGLGQVIWLTDLIGGVPLVCDWDGDGGANLGRVIGGAFFLDANGNGTWDDNAGGDLSSSFLPPAGVGAPIAGRWKPSSP